MSKRVLEPYLKEGSQKLTDLTEIMKFWADDNELKLDNLSTGSQRDAIWKCTNGLDHTFTRKIAKRIDLHDCPVCKFQIIHIGFNDLATTNPEIAAEWSSNNSLKSTEVMRNHEKDKFLWIGKGCGHEWDMPIKSRTVQKQNCPYCAGQRVLAGFNDLSTTAPELLKFWNFEKNILKPTEISKGSNKKIWWLCEKNHDVLRSPKDWSNIGCNYCSGRKTLEGFNDLFTVAPHLKDEWDYDKNTDDPKTVRFNNRDYAFWKCGKCDHEWKSIVRGRVKGIGCPICGQNSFLEETVKTFLDANYSGIVLRRRKPLENSDGRKLELDFWLPELNLAIEVQDFATHSKDSETEYTDYRAYDDKENYKKGPTYHANKRSLAKAQLDVTLVELWEDTVRSGDEAIFEILKEYLEVEEVVINNSRIQKMVESRRIAFESLDHEENILSFSEFNSKTKHDVLSWICPEGHKYETTMRQQIGNKQPCMECVEIRRSLAA